jgi:hypothetical protein
LETLKLSLFWLACLTLGACATGQCKRDGTLVQADEETTTITEQQLANEIILIGKSDQSLQCGYNIGVSISRMAQELENIQILRSEKRHDGLMRIQTCGAPTGMMNVYAIYRKDVKKAVKMGYKVLDTGK